MKQNLMSSALLPVGTKIKGKYRLKSDIPFKQGKYTTGTGVVIENHWIQFIDGPIRGICLVVYIIVRIS